VQNSFACLKLLNNRRNNCKHHAYGIYFVYVMEKVYTHSKTLFIYHIALDVILSFVLVGIILLIVDILRYTTNKLILTNTGVILKTGLFGNNSIEIPRDKINSISVKKGLLGSIFGVGDIYILTGNDVEGECFSQVDHPDQVRSELLETPTA
jgi:uncharacterized membrane protein YdbT with pleckstrin-like domain